MKQRVLFLAIGIMAMLIVQGQTQVSGGIFSNTTWTVANSPYIVTGNLVVFPGVTLTINPGVEVRVAEAPSISFPYYIEARGSIIMVGTATQKITVKAQNAVTQVGSWQGFVVKNSQGGSITFDYVHIANAVNSFVYDSFVPPLFDLHHCVFNYNGSGINAGNTLNAYDCTFKGNNAAVSGWANFTLEGCVFDSNGIAVSAYASTFLMDSCTLINNSMAISFSSSVFNGMTIKNTLIEGNTIGMYYPSNGVIENCAFLNNTTGIAGSSSITITDCNFSGNDLAVEAGFATTVKNCEINSNDIGVALGPLTFGQPVPIIENNTICYNQNYNLDNRTDLNLFVPTNCFCETDSALVEAKLLDGYDDVTKGLISYAIFDTSCTNVLKMVNKGPSFGLDEDITVAITLWPNPATSEFIFQNSSELLSVEVYDAQGRLHARQMLVDGTNTVQIGQLNPGMYIARFVDSKGKGFSEKLAKY
jgi:hypothetical protein